MIRTGESNPASSAARHEAHLAGFVDAVAAVVAAVAGGGFGSRGVGGGGGGAMREGAVRAAGIDVPTDLGFGATKASADDIVDASAVASTALRIADGNAVAHADPPEVNESGRLMAIWS